jgi:hypothetical protein
MDRVIRQFDSFQAADEAEDRYYADLTPAERLDLLLELIARENEAYGEAAERFARVHRVTQLSRG